MYINICLSSRKAYVYACPYYLFISLEHICGNETDTSKIEDIPSLINSCSNLYIETIHIKMRRLIYKTLRSYINFISTAIHSNNGQLRIMVSSSLIPIFISVHKRLLFDYQRLGQSNIFIISYPTILSLHKFN